MRSAPKILPGVMDLVAQILVFVKSTAVGKNVSWKSLQKIVLRILEENGLKMHLKIIGSPSLQVRKYFTLTISETFDRNITGEPHYLGLFTYYSHRFTGVAFSSNTTLQNQANTVKGNIDFTRSSKSTQTIMSLQ